VGDPLALTLEAVGGEDFYAATLHISYDPEKVSLDLDQVTSDFPGMASISGFEGAIDFTVSRLGTSSGGVGDLPLGSLGFVASGAGEALISIDTLSIVDSGLGRIDSAPATALSYTVAPLPVPPTETPSPTSAPAPTEGAGGAETASAPISVTMFGSGFTRSTGGISSGTAPQMTAAPTNTTATIVASSLAPKAGDKITLTVLGLAPNAAHRIELHSDPIVLDEVMSDSTGSFLIETTIPKNAPTGEHEIVVLSDGSVVASLPVTIVAASDATPSPSPSASPIVIDAPEAANGAAQLDAAATSSPSSAWILWVLIAVVVVLIAAAIVTMVIRTRHAASGEGDEA